jgi:hypothetical protein
MSAVATPPPRSTRFRRLASRPIAVVAAALIGLGALGGAAGAVLGSIGAAGDHGPRPAHDIRGERGIDGGIGRH